MTDSLYIVSVRVKHKGAIIIIMIMRSKPWCAVVATTSGERGCIESINRSAVLGDKRYVHSRDRFGIFSTNPEISLFFGPIARKICFAIRHAHDVQWRKGLIIKQPRLFKITHFDRYMVKHDLLYDVIFSMMWGVF